MRRSSLRPSALRRPAPVLSAAAPEGGGQLASFGKWLEANGVASEKAQPAQLAGWGTCLVAGPSGVKEGDTLLSIPATLHLSPTAVAATPLGEAVAAVVPRDDHSALLALGLLAELSRGEGEGSMSPYLALLPSGGELHAIPLLWTEDELATLLAGSHLHGAVQQARALLLEQWAAIEAQVLPQHPALFPRDVFNAEGYLWAHAIVLSRALPFGDELHLIPFLDLANHAAGAPNMCSIGVDGGGVVTEASQLDGKEASAVLTAGKDAAPGEQIFIDYGEAGWRSSWEMLYTYGFVPGAGLAEWISSGGRPLFFDGVLPSDPLHEQKRALLSALGAQEGAVDGTWVDLKPTAASCTSMAPLLRLAYLGRGDGDAATALAEWRAEPTELWAVLQKPVAPDAEAKVAAQVLQVCHAALDELPAADALAPRAARAESPENDTPEDERSRLAARVMLGERSALEACIGVWEKARGAAAAAGA